MSYDPGPSCAEDRQMQRDQFNEEQQERQANGEPLLCEDCHGHGKRLQPIRGRDYGYAVQPCDGCGGSGMLEIEVFVDVTPIVALAA